MFWETLVRVLRYFVHLNVSRQLLALVVMVACLMGVWSYGLKLRRDAIRDSLGMEYATQLSAAASCRASAKVMNDFHDACVRAINATRLPLDDHAGRIAWENSYVCGGSSCFDVLFGSDASMLGVSMRFLFIAVIAAIATLVVSAAQKCLSGFDQYAKNKSRTYYDHDTYVYQKHPAGSTMSRNPKSKPGYDSAAPVHIEEIAYEEHK